MSDSNNCCHTPAVWVEGYHGNKCLRYSQNEVLLREVAIAKNCCANLDCECTPKLVFSTTELIGVCKNAPTRQTVNFYSNENLSAPLVREVIVSDGSGNYDITNAVSNFLPLFDSTGAPGAGTGTNTGGIASSIPFFQGSVSLDLVGNPSSVGTGDNNVTLQVAVQWDNGSNLTVVSYVLPANEPADGQVFTARGNFSAVVNGYCISLETPTLQYNAAQASFTVQGDLILRGENYLKDLISNNRCDECCLEGKC